MARRRLFARLLALPLIVAAALACPQSDDPAPEALERYRETLAYKLVAEQEARRTAARSKIKAHDARPLATAAGES